MKKILSFAKDFILGAIGLVVLNAAMSLLVMPTIERTLGADFQGRVLYYTSLASYLTSIGFGLNYGRMKIYAKERETVNGEFNLMLIGAAAMTALVTIAAIIIKGDTAETSWLLIILFMILTVVRNYADVAFRLRVNYKLFSLFYCSVGLGYAVGLLLFKLTGAWILIFYTGELFGLLFVFFTSTLFMPPYFERTPAFSSHVKGTAVITGSFLLSDFVSAADRLLIPTLLAGGALFNGILYPGDTLTSLFYYASFVGKIMSLLSTPLNGVLSGYIAREEGGLAPKLFLKVIAALIAVVILVTGVSYAGSHLFVYLFYPDWYTVVRPLFLLANAGQVLFFICNTLMVVVLRYTEERNQMIVSVCYIAAFFATAVPLTLRFGIWGMAWSIFIVNALKFVLFTFLGYRSLRRDSRKNAA